MWRGGEHSCSCHLPVTLLLVLILCGEEGAWVFCNKEEHHCNVIYITVYVCPAQP